MTKYRGLSHPINLHVPFFCVLADIFLGGMDLNDRGKDDVLGTFISIRSCDGMNKKHDPRKSKNT